MSVDWKCDTCQETYPKLVAPFAGGSEKFCLGCFAFGLGLVATNKPDLAEYYNQMVNQIQKQLEQSKPNSIVFLSKNFDQKKLNEWLGKFTKGTKN